MHDGQGGNHSSTQQLFPAQVLLVSVGLKSLGGSGQVCVCMCVWCGFVYACVCVGLRLCVSVCVCLCLSESICLLE